MFDLEINVLGLGDANHSLPKPKQVSICLKLYTKK